MKKSPLPMKDFKFRPMLVTYGHWAVRVFLRALSTVTRGIRLWYHLLGTMICTSVAERLAMEISLPVFKTYVCRIKDSNSQSFVCKTNALIDCATAALRILLNTLYTLCFFSFYIFSSKHTDQQQSQEPLSRYLRL